MVKSNLIVMRQTFTNSPEESTDTFCILSGKSAVIMDRDSLLRTFQKTRTTRYLDYLSTFTTYKTHQGNLPIEFFVEGYTL